MNTGEGLHRFVDPVDDEVYLYSQFEVADSRRVFAVFEQPDLKATFSLHGHGAPSHWTGRLQLPHPRAGAGSTAGDGDLALRADPAAGHLRHRDRRRPVPPRRAPS